MHAFELGERQRPHVAAEAVVDDGELVGLELGIGREQIGHHRNS